ncbi:MAG: zinc-ribbon domain-containing protein [Bacilli bacterium]|nr:zinc-ribbon domain-containing protein [Bacilli bacterium]
MYCYKCGKKNKEKATFCEECGTKLFPKEKEEVVEKEVIKEIEKNDEVVSKAVKTTAKAAGKTMKFTTKLVVFIGILAAVLIGLNYYFTVKVASPDQVVRKAVTAMEKNDIKTFVSCTDPKFQNQFNLGLGVVGGIINGATGIGLDWNNLLDLQSAFGEYIEDDDFPKHECNASDYKIVEIKGDKLPDFMNDLAKKFPAIGNALGTEAIIEFEVDNSEKCNMSKEGSNETRVKHQLKVRKYGKEWLIPIEENEEMLKDATN